MSSSDVIRSSASPFVNNTPTSSPAGRSSLQRLPALALGLLGAGVLVFGVSLPWVSTFGGLFSKSGWGTRNGSILLAGAALSALLAVGQQARESATARWLLAFTGFATAGFAGYLLIQLHTVTQESDAVALVSREPGLYVATAGAALVFATIFLGMPVSTAPDQEARPSDVPAALPSGLRAIGSPLRYPAAVLALAAGLAHVPVTPEHLNEAPYIGVLFILLTTVCILLAAALMISDASLVWATLGASCLLAVLAFVISRTVGLPLIADDIGNWLESLAVVSVLTETGVVVLSGLVLARRRLGTINGAHS